MQVIIVNSKGVLFESAAGLADLKNSVPMTMAHTMAAFSMSKTVTAIAVLQLVGQKRLSLDDTVTKFVHHPYDQGITVRQLLSHTAGVPNPIPLKWVHRAEAEEGFSEEAALKAVLEKNPQAGNEPGKRYRYSNLGYWLLGKVVEQVSGMSFTAYVKEKIFEPLAIPPDQMSFEIVQPQHHAKGYLAKYSLMNLFKWAVTDSELWGEYEGRWLHIHNVYANGPAFGGIIGNARGFATLLQDLLCAESKLLGKEMKQLLLTNEHLASGADVDMTLGWHVKVTDGVRVLYKEGGGAGYRTEMRIYPEAGIASVLMTNRTRFDTGYTLMDFDREFILKQ
jgi:CubicO group peptidase (beta-lactamase class C family)